MGAGRQVRKLMPQSIRDDGGLQSSLNWALKLILYIFLSPWNHDICIIVLNQHMEYEKAEVSYRKIHNGWYLSGEVWYAQVYVYYGLNIEKISKEQRTIFSFFYYPKYFQRIWKTAQMFHEMKEKNEMLN